MANPNHDERGRFSSGSGGGGKGKGPVGRAKRKSDARGKDRATSRAAVLTEVARTSARSLYHAETRHLEAGPGGRLDAERRRMEKFEKKNPGVAARREFAYTRQKSDAPIGGSRRDAVFSKHYRPWNPGVRNVDKPVEWRRRER